MSDPIFEKSDFFQLNSREVNNLNMMPNLKYKLWIARMADAR